MCRHSGDFRSLRQSWRMCSRCAPLAGEPDHRNLCTSDAPTEHRPGVFVVDRSPVINPAPWPVTPPTGGGRTPVRGVLPRGLQERPTTVFLMGVQGFRVATRVLAAG